MKAKYTLILTSWLNNPNEPQTTQIGNYDDLKTASISAENILMALIKNQPELTEWIDEAFYAMDTNHEEMFCIAIRDNETGEIEFPILKEDF